MNSKKMTKNKFKKMLPLWCMTVPFFIVVVIFAIVPLWGWLMAFVQYKPGNQILQCDFVGLKWFKYLFGGGDMFYRALRNTLVFSGIGLLLSPLPMIFAILLNELPIKKFKSVVQTVASFPNFISWIIVYSIACVFFSVESGVVNQRLIEMGALTKGIDFLATKDFVYVIQPLLGTWKTVGWSAIIYLSAIASLDQALFEAAQVDGASRWQQIRYIMIPGLLPTFSMLLLLSVGNILSAGFDQYYIFGNPMVIERMEVLDTYAYRLGLGQLNFSLATAVGLFKTVVGVTLLSIANYSYKRINGRSLI